MNSKERMMAALRREEPDQIPFTLYAESPKLLALAIYEPWRKLLDQGLGLFAALSVQTHKTECPNTSMNITHHYKSQTSWSPVDLMISMNKPHEISGEIKTAVGTDKFFATMETMDLAKMLPWFPQDGFFIKNLEDYDVFRCLIEDTEYTPFYDEIVGFQQIIGNHGIVPTFVPKSPFHSMLMLMGPHRLAIEYYTHRKEFNELYNAIYKKELEVYKIAAESPAEVVWGPDNVTGLVTSPRFFKDYCLKFYNEVSDIFHKHDKIYVVHMDGELTCIADLVAGTGIDAIESFTPPPIGDLSIKDAKEKWKDKVIWSNFPETVSLEGQKAVEETTKNMLKEAAPGNNFLLGISEGFPSFMHQLQSVPTILKTINKFGKYPIGE